MSTESIKIARIAALGVLIGALLVVGTRPSVRAYFELEYLRALTSDAGTVGVLTFLGLWTCSYLMQIPGLVFVLVALLAWGPWTGSAVAFVGLIVTTSTNFWALRTVGGSPVADVEHPWVRSLLDHLDESPIRTVALLRTLFLVNPLINLSLILTEIRFRHYLVGSILGFILPVAVLAVGTETVLEYVVAA